MPNKNEIYSILNNLILFQLKHNFNYAKFDFASAVHTEMTHCVLSSKMMYVVLAGSF